MRYLSGSSHFFKDYKDFHPHDTDYLEFVDITMNKRIIRGTVKGNDLDIVQLKRKPKDELIRDALSSKLPMVVGKFLVPEFNKEIGFTVEDLPKIKPLIDKIDSRHLYEKIIYEAYLENGKFELTEEQRNRAYEEYKKYRI